MTQKQLLETVLSELSSIKQHMPNGELKQMQKDMEDLKEDMSDLKYTLLNPENGVIVNTNKNTDFRKEMQAGEREFQHKLSELEELKRWKDGVSKALWIIFTVLAGLVIRMLAEISDKV
jgi:predicted  nucleic acid-binding Zn-ribbon protein